MNKNGLVTHFRLAQFRFVLKALNSLSLPSYKGSTFRGAFGHTFKKVVCVNRERRCDLCLLKGKCIYSYVFETPPPSGSLKMKKYPFAPHPFVITPPLDKKQNYRVDEELSFGLTLVGNSIDYLPYFVYTFSELGKIGFKKGGGKFELQRVYVEQVGVDSDIIYSSGDKSLINRPYYLDIGKLLSYANPENIKRIGVRLITPMRLKFNEALSPRLEFHILLRNLLRRISLLSYFHCGWELDLDFKGLIERGREIRVQKSNLLWFDWERFSSRQNSKMKMGGLTGSVVFEGDLGEFMPYLLIGEYVHVGKGTSFGLGKYKITQV